MRFFFVIWSAILFCLRAIAGFHIEDLDWNKQSDDGIPEGFYPIKELGEFLSPFIEKGFSMGVAQGDLKELGIGAYGATYRIQWPGYQNGAIAKINKIRTVARREASFLAYLDGAAGAPKLLAFHNKTGMMAMESVGLTEIGKLRDIGLSREYLLMLFMALTHDLNELHNQGVVHGDLKPNNVMVSFDARGVPYIHFIDFGMSTLSGIRGGSVLRKKDWKERLTVRPWYSKEYFTGEILDNRADFPGLAYIMRRLMPDMKSYCQRLYQVTEIAMSHERNARPYLGEVFQVLLEEYHRLK